MAARVRDVWLIVTGRLSLHSAYEAGFHDGHHSEWKRIIINMGDIDAQRANVRKAEENMEKRQNDLGRVRSPQGE